MDLLCHITNATNVETVCEKLLSHLKSTTDADVYFRTELVDRITELAERYPFAHFDWLKRKLVSLINRFIQELLPSWVSCHPNLAITCLLCNLPYISIWLILFRRMFSFFGGGGEGGGGGGWGHWYREISFLTHSCAHAQ